ncbi:MAG: rRNA pseudouridine synthase [Candidatus Latescibacteria bacterium]|nr:rRNA pseudouridine synthase [Candidatus Latescibacterota bacterium]
MDSTPKTTSTPAASAPRASAEEIRLNHFLAQVGIASRRACDAVIAAGRVRVNGRVVREMGTKVAVGVDHIEVDGVAVGRTPRRIVLLMHKPKGIVSTVTDPEGRPTVADLARRVVRKQRLFPVGRLDVNTTGALLITNDGFLCYKLTHPRYEIARVYHVRVRGRFDESTERRLQHMASEGARERATRARSAREKSTRPRPGVELVAKLPKETVLKITLLEGRNRQVRNMIEAVGLHVTALKRVSFGPVSIRGLPLGAIRSLDKKELDRLEAAVGGIGGDR